MKTLASDVGDLRKVLTNVKTRGTWGEIQLGALLEQILHRDQYESNVAVIPGASERVEFAIRLPGAGEGKPVWLPIDSKFPQEDYLRIVEASERGDAEAITESRKALERRVVEEAKKINSKYVETPHTTDFAILFVPVEGLFAEILRIDGLAERVMRDYRVVISGPTTVAALLNSLQMGFRTLAVEKRSSEVWVLLGQVKTEFGKFGAILEKAQSKIEQAGKELEGAGRRTKAIERKLRDVAELPFEPAAEDLETLVPPGEEE
jgi:DNA recombination protein RmuC